MARAKGLSHQGTDGVGAGFLGPSDQTVPSRGEASWGSAEEEEEEG